jgi:hypothetical protein
MNEVIVPVSLVGVRDSGVVFAGAFDSGALLEKTLCSPLRGQDASQTCSRCA